MDMAEECHKWKLAYQTLGAHSENESVLTASETDRSYDGTSDSGVRDVQSPTDESSDVVSQVMMCSSFSTFRQRFHPSIANSIILVN